MSPCFYHRTRLFLTIFIFLGVFSGKVLAQDDSTFVLSVVDSESKLSIPFSHIIYGTNHYLSDIDGLLELKKDSSVHHLSVKNDNYEIYLIDSINVDTLIVPLKRINNFSFIRYTSYDAKKLMNKVLAYRFKNDPEGKIPFYYNTYNKFHIASNKIKDTKGFIKELLARVQLKLTNYPEAHHLIISESVTNRRYMSDLNEQEVITSSRISGVERPRLVSINSQMQSLSLYKRFIRIAGNEFTNPVNNNTFIRYQFEVVDTIPRGDFVTYVVKFNPKLSARFESVKGYYFINSDQFAIEAAIIEPAISRGLHIRSMQQSKQVDGKWFPYKYYTILTLDNLTDKKLSFTATTKTVISDLVLDTSYSKKQFSDIAIKYDPNTDYTESYWESVRKLPLTERDKHTYAFYDSVGTIKNFDRILNIGEHLYFKEIAFKNTILEIRHLIAYNNFEGLRLGIGGRTSENISKFYSLGGYAAYGFKDNGFKFGANLFLNLYPKYEIEAKLSSFYDVKEAGLPNFHFDRPQYSTEWLRKLNVQYMDYITAASFDLSAKPARYLHIFTNALRSHQVAMYNYNYTPRNTRSFNYATWSVGFRYAFGERFFLLLHKKFPFSTYYPIVWFEYVKGFNNFGGEYSFSKIISKLEWDIPIIGWGTSHIQISSGMAIGQLPYFQLFSGRGSLGLNSITHNSFETMGYNEFLNDKFFYLFYAHNFGYINFIKNKNFRPSIEAAFNMGFGHLTHPDRHDNVPFKTLEKGYYEAGFLVNDLLVIRPAGIKAGFGIGYYNRFGPYRYATLRENSLIKLSLKLVI